MFNELQFDDNSFSSCLEDKTGRDEQENLENIFISRIIDLDEDSVNQENLYILKSPKNSSEKSPQSQKEVSLIEIENKEEPQEKMELEINKLAENPLSHINEEKKEKAQTKEKLEEIALQNKETQQKEETSEKQKKLFFRVFNSKEKDKELKGLNKSSSFILPFIGKKRGRIPANMRKDQKESINAKIHDNMSSDNLLRKTQVNYISFLINFFNALINSYEQTPKKIKVAKEPKTKLKKYEKEQFLNLNYETIKNVNKEFIAELKQKTIEEIFSYDISPKFKLLNKDQNQKVCKTISKKFPDIGKLLKKKYLDFFEYIYFVNKKIINLKKFGIDKILDFSEKHIPTYEDLLKKFNGEGKGFRKKLEECLRKNGYIREFKPIPVFNTSINED